jgi:polysaccharide biosynthesis protein PslH
VRVLLLTQVLPHPPDSGPKVKTASVLRYLAERHEVTLASFTRGEQADDVAHLRRICRAVHAVPIHRGRARDLWHLGGSLLRGESFLMARDSRAAMRDLVQGLLAAGDVDVLHVDQLNMAQYAAAAGSGARVLDAHNALWLVTERLAATMPPGPRRWLLAREGRLLKEYEGRVCREFEGVLAVSEEDRAALLAAAGAAVDIGVVPIAIDVEAQPMLRREAGADHLLHIGSLVWPPSVDGLLWFLREVLPRVRSRRPSAVVDVVGGNPPAAVRAAGARDAGVRVHGYVVDPAPLSATAGVMVVPLRAGGGMRVRILNGLAQGVPMVTTSIGCEGIAVEHGRHLLIADTPADFADAVSRLLDDPDLAASLARQGRRLAEERYDFRVVCRGIDAVYAGAIDRARRAGGGR